MAHDKAEGSWPALVAHALDDVLRIVQAELRLVELGLKSVLEQQVAQFAAALLAIGLSLLGGGLLLAALVLLLDRVMPLWIALAVTGLVAIACGWLLRTLVGRAYRRRSPRPLEPLRS